MAEIAPRSPLFPDAERAYRVGDLKRAARLCRSMIKGDSEDVAAWSLQGAVLRQTGEFEGARESLFQAVELDPNALEARLMLVTVLGDLGEIDQALEQALVARDLAGDDIDVLNHLGVAFADARHFDEALATFDLALAADSDNLRSKKNRAAALRDAGREAEAFEAWQEVVRRSPNEAEAWLSLGQLQMGRGNFEEALKSGRQASRLAPDSAQAKLMTGLALAELKKPTEAEPQLRKAIDLDPDDALAHAALGFWCQEQGRFGDAQELLDRAIDLNPLHGFAHFNRFRARKAKPEDRPELERLKDLLQQTPDASLDRAYFGYALGKAHEDLGEFETSFAHYAAANETAYKIWFGKRPWDREAYAADLDRKMARYDRAWAERLLPQIDDETPLLIVGMIRSGTSLVEQILSSHPDVAGGGELTYWHDHEDEAEASEEGLLQIGERYVKELRAVDRRAKHVTDKLPHNFALLGPILSAFPKAKVVHLRRNPADNCVSVYTTAFQKPPSFAHSRENIAFAFGEYRRMMAHWRSVLPTDTLIEVDYEELVADRETVTRRLIDFVGLDWDDKVLRHDTNQRSVRTPSLWQVRQPIYTTSVERWRRFEPWVPEFARLMGDVS